MAKASKDDTGDINYRFVGIGSILASDACRVPEYQRSYSWTVDGDEQVVEFWNDLAGVGAMGQYFLGTIVMSREGDASLIIDGQQRLATTCLLLAAIRDQFLATSHAKTNFVETEYLVSETLESAGPISKLTLNLEDDDYFGRIIRRDATGEPDPKYPSQLRLAAAYAYLRAQVAVVAATSSDELIEIVDLLAKRAKVAAISVADETDAYTVFETLNDRGADLTTADLLKNYLYRQSGSKLAKVQAQWATALGTLEASAADHRFTAFLRHYWSSLHGLTSQKALYKAIKPQIKTEASAVRFANGLVKNASYYAALKNRTHPQWTDLDDTARESLDVLIRIFDLTPNRPLLMAACDKLSKKELGNLLTALLAWSIRGVVLETINSGSTEEKYCEAAQAIRGGALKTTDAIRDFLRPVLPTDKSFQDAFAIAKVTRNNVARYYLRTLELQQAGDVEPENVPNANSTKINLEHVLAQKANPAEWTDITDASDVTTWAYRLGNMALLKKSENGALGNRGFATKKTALNSSSFALTKQIGAKGDWRPKDIEARQLALAKLAVSAWPL